MKKPSFDMLSRITALMEEQEVFRRKNLRLEDLAAELGAGSEEVSACINGLVRQSVPAFINGYRLRYAQALMRRQPGLPLSTVALESGFSNETSFLRNFKAQAGCSPEEWITYLQ